MPIFTFKDNENLVETSKFPYAEFPFDYFNPVQSRVFEFYEKDANGLIAANTSAGKTAVAEMYLSHEIHKRGGKGMFLGPYKSLTQEKINEWSDDGHHFSKLNKSICTGDYRLTPDRKKELENSDIIIMTSEMLNSKSRNFKHDKSGFLKEIGTLVVDESQLLGMSHRGSHLESGIMKFTEINPDCRVIFLSATMPNVEEIAEWLSKITNKDTNVLLSEYRPCPLHIHYRTYEDDIFDYELRERSKVFEALGIIQDYPEDKFLVVVQSKTTGRYMVEDLTLNGIECDYHNADLDFKKRMNVEKRFIEDSNLKVIVATSTLSTGVNLPARRVIVLGVHIGLQEVEAYNILQAIGRAGRPKYDKRGDAYILLPESEEQKHKERLSQPEPIISQMCDMKILAFHIISEICQGNVQTDEDIKIWYKRSLASFQAKNLDDDIVQNVITGLKSCKAIKEHKGKYKATPIGRVASLFYCSPFDIANLKYNFDILFDNNKEKDDLWISMALGNIDTNYSLIVNKRERKDMHGYSLKITKGKLGKVMSVYTKYGLFSEGVIKAGFCYHLLLSGKSNRNYNSIMRQFKMDSPRTIEILNALDKMVAKWNMKSYFKALQSRISYGVSWDIAEIVTIPNIGRVKAQRLWDYGLTTLGEIAGNPNKIKQALKCSEQVAVKISKYAKALLDD